MDSKHNPLQSSGRQTQSAAPNTAVQNDLATRPSHTPGPFELYPTTWVMNGVTFRNLNDAEGRTVALIPLDSRYLEDGIGESNGLLFRAAPDMLAALKAAKELGNLIPRDVYEQVLAAIAKAQGGAE